MSIILNSSEYKDRAVKTTLFVYDTDIYQRQSQVDYKNQCKKKDNGLYQSPLILTELFQHNLINGMLPLSGHDDVALFEYRR